MGKPHCSWRKEQGQWSGARFAIFTNKNTTHLECLQRRAPYKLFSSAHSVVSDSATPWTAACQASLSFTISQSLLKFMSIEWVMPPSNLIHCHPLLLLPPGFPSIRVFSNELALHIRWPRYWSFSISPSRKYSGFFPRIFRIDWFDLLTVQGTLKSPLHHHILKTLIPWHSAFFMV